VNGRLPLFWLALYRRRRMLAALAFGMVAFETLITVIAATIPPEQLFAGPVRPPGAGKAFSGSGGSVSLASYPGLLGAGMVHPFWIAMQLTAVGSFAAAAVAADVEAGTIELLMARPISRARLLTERVAALVAASVLLNAAATAAVTTGVALSPRVHGFVPLPHVAAAGVLGFGLALCLAGPALAVSAAGRRKAHVVGATIALGAVGFAVNFVAIAWSPVAFLRYASPFHYYAPADVLAHGGFPYGSLAALLAVSAGGIAVAARLLDRRDLAP